MSTNAVPYALRLPVSLKAALEEAAKADGTSLNQFLVMAAAEKLSAMKTAEAFIAERSERADIKAAMAFLKRKGGETPAAEDSL
ncbi:MAG: toxin-antitoxin system HicB family antitoxin [Pseudomonadota bacterium]